MELLGKKLKYQRERKKYSLASVVYLLHEKFNLNTTKSTLSKYENGTLTPRPDTILAFSQLYGVSCDYLLDDSIGETSFLRGFSSVSYVNIIFNKASDDFKFKALQKSVPVQFDLKPGTDYFAVTVQDDSMEPFLYCGDAVVCSCCGISDVTEDGLYVVYIRRFEKIFIRRAFIKNSTVFFKPDNILYHLDFQRMDPGASNDVFVLGKVLETIHLLN